MKRGMEWYKREPIAFLDGVQGMGPELIGAYAVILDLIYARGGESRRDDHHLAGILGCSVRKARALTDAVVATGRLSMEGDFIVNSRAKRDAKKAWNTRETLSNAGRKGGEKSGEVRRNKALREANAKPGFEAEKRREEELTATVALNGCARGENQQKQRADFNEIDTLYLDLLHIAGHTSGTVPKYWQPPGAMTEIQDWLSRLKLPPDTIRATAKAQRQKHPDRPDGPKAWRRAMEAAADQAAKPRHPGDWDPMVAAILGGKL